jgi:hypothetical protein
MLLVPTASLFDFVMFSQPRVHKSQNPCPYWRSERAGGDGARWWTCRQATVLPWPANRGVIQIRVYLIAGRVLWGL